MITDQLDLSVLTSRSLVPPGHRVALPAGYPPGWVPDGLDKHQAQAALREAKKALFSYQERLYAQAQRSLLIILQGIDASGKDGTVAHVMEGVNPAGVSVHSFKSPSSLERSHDYFWRHAAALPELGRIAIFNRSHYENVLITRVHPEMLWPRTSGDKPENLWKQRFDQINAWEKMLTESGTVIVKLFLNLSQQEQARRFLARIDDPSKNWKISPSDVKERAYWNEYQSAFSDMLSNTSTSWAPWHVLPADKKWCARLGAIAVILQALENIDPHYPQVTDPRENSALTAMRSQLMSEC